MERPIDMKLCRVGHIAVGVFDNRLLLIWGGYMQHEDSDGDLTFRYHDPQEVVLFDPLLETWTIKTTGGEVPPSNSGTCGIILDDHLYIFGGYFGDPDVEGNSNNLYSLNLKSWSWTRLEPNGLKPLHCDKLIGWSYMECLYFFGGFGSPPSKDELKLHKCEFISDGTHRWFLFERGWNNQLVKYDIRKNLWERPATVGKRPSPRAAMAGFQQAGKVYIFGGRLSCNRMNDLYVLDMASMSWSEDLNSEKYSPVGRSWHSFTPVSSSKAILYGGLSSDGTVLDDMWLYSMKENSWLEMDRPKGEKRLWHQTACLDTELITIGGIRTNLHRNPQEPLEFAHQILTISVTPRPLLRLCIEKITSFRGIGEDMLSYLPNYLQSVIRVRQQNMSQPFAAPLTNLPSSNRHGL